MKFAILAAGEGSRLQKEGITQPKPLVEINGEKMIDRLIRIFLANHATEIDIITNDLTNRVQDHIHTLQRQGLPIRLVVKTTPSSMHSLHHLQPLLQDSPFCLTTVDTIFPEHEFARMISQFATTKADGLMGITDYIDDESPLHITINSTGQITGFLDTNPNPRYISAGIYCLRPSAFTILNQCIANGESRMRNFQRALLASGAKLDTYRFTKVFDIDHKSDIQKANRIVSQYENPLHI